MQPILEWLKSNPWGKKFLTFLSGAAASAWFCMKFWLQIKQTREAWGISQEALLNFLLAVAGLGGGALSVILTMLHESDKKAAANVTQDESKGVPKVEP